MKYPTKQKRMEAVIEAYLAKFHKSAFTTTEVAEWALRTGLYPVPKRGDSVVECLKWEKRFAEVVGA
jgi:hypothetical protein